jgi:O-antigen/teichoic acid export membrane protein
VGRLAVLLCYDRPVTRRLLQDEPAVEPELLSDRMARMAALARTGAPLSVKTLLVALNTHVARYFVAAKFGLAGLGVFFPIAQLGFAGLTFSRALNQSVAGRVGRLAQSGQMQEFRNLLGRLLGVYALLGAACIGVAALFGTTILTVAFDSGFAPHSGILTLVMVAMAMQFMTGILDLAMIALRRRILPAWLSAVSLLLLSLACWQWVPEYGFTGAAAAMIVSRLPRPLVLGWVVFRAAGPVEELQLRQHETLRGAA